MHRCNGFAVAVLHGLPEKFGEAGKHTKGVDVIGQIQTGSLSRSAIIVNLKIVFEQPREHGKFRPGIEERKQVGYRFRTPYGKDFFDVSEGLGLVVAGELATVT